MTENGDLSTAVEPKLSLSSILQSMIFPKVLHVSSILATGAMLTKQAMRLFHAFIELHGLLKMALRLLIIKTRTVI